MTKKEIKEFIDNNYQKIFNTINQNIDKIYQLNEIHKFKTPTRNRDVVNSFDRHLTPGERNYSQSKMTYAWTWVRHKPEICFNIPLIKKHKLTKAKIISMICHEIFHVYNFPVSENFTSPIPTKYTNYPPEFWAEFFEDW